MSLESTIQRVAAINNALANPALLVQSSLSGAGKTVSQTGGTAAPSGTASFADALEAASAPPESEAGAYGAQAAAPGVAGALGGASGALSAAGALPYPGLSQASGLGPSSPTAAVGGSYAGQSPGQRIVAIAETQVGQTEQPPGSNESPAIAQYRTATAGAIPGAPWCAYFASWAARQAGEPIGSQGQGLGAVSEIWSWAQSVGRAIPNGPGVVPAPGDLIVFGGEHVGIVRRVLPNGDIETIEGNYENKVALNVRTPSEPTGYVNMS
ncbi:MAG: CHAP domain-containing protein [Solirubrobacteraceae bacterium]